METVCLEVVILIYQLSIFFCSEDGIHMQTYRVQDVKSMARDQRRSVVGREQRGQLGQGNVIILVTNEHYHTHAYTCMW